MSIEHTAKRAIEVLMSRYDVATVERLLVLLNKPTKPGSEDRAIQDRTLAAILRNAA